MSSAAAAAATGLALEASSQTTTGESVTVYVSDSYPPEQVAPEAWADFFAGLPHGRELASVTVRIAPLTEIAAICGPDAAGCYWNNELAFAGEQVGDAMPEATARHEYGHHIAGEPDEPAVARPRLGNEAVGHRRAGVLTGKGRHGLPRGRERAVRAEPGRGLR